ncbi:MAG: hypothetical protein ACHQJ4_01625 [Ignavibacteria bacterium]
MKKLFYICAITLFFILFVKNEVIAQPKFIINAYGGYGMPLGDFTITPPTPDNNAVNPGVNSPDADFYPYYTKNVINFGADGKLAIGKKGNFRVVFGVSYNMFSNSFDAKFKANSGDTLPGGGVTTTFKPKVNIISIALGGEWAFLPKGKVNPFVGLDATANFFGGSFDFGGTSVFVKGAQRTGPMDMKAETRIGLQIGGGVDFMLSKQVGIIVGAKYHIINLLGKGADVESEVGPNEIDLGDKEHTLDDGTTSPNKTLTSLQFYAGVSFYFGAPKKTK